LIGLHLPNALADAVPLCEGRSDRQEQFADPIAGDVAAQVEEVVTGANSLLAPMTLWIPTRPEDAADAFPLLPTAVAF
jgi:hypothetical protein